MRKLALALVFAVACGTGLTAWPDVEAWLLTTEHLAVERVEVVGADRVEAEVIVGASSVRPGQSLLALSASIAAARVEALPWIRSATVAKNWPRRVRISVDEHEAVAVVALGALFYVDDRGRAFARFEDGVLDLPIILGLEREAYVHGDAETLSRLRVAIELIRTWGERDPRLATVEVGAGYLARFEDERGRQVLVGPPPFEAALEDAREALASNPDATSFALGRGRRRGRIAWRGNEEGR